MGDIKFSIQIPLDKNGMIGRECLECEQYFKLKPGTGLDTDICHCPYCNYSGNMNTFWTPAQLEYAKSIAMQQAFQKIVKPSLEKLNKSFKDLERKTRNSLIKFKVTTPNKIFNFPIKYYQEEDLETLVNCDNCKLEFAIYGVFSKCPDCNQSNAFLIFNKSIEVTRKKLEIFSNPEIPEDIIEMSYNSTLSSVVSAFDALGKELRKRKENYYPSKPKNLFQNLAVLNEILDTYISDNHSNYQELFKYFQVRHINEHNMGVIDQDFINKVPEYKHLLGRKFHLTKENLSNFLNLIEELGELIKKDFNK